MIVSGTIFRRKKKKKSFCFLALLFSKIKIKSILLLLLLLLKTKFIIQRTSRDTNTSRKSLSSRTRTTETKVTKTIFVIPGDNEIGEGKKKKKNIFTPFFTIIINGGAFQQPSPLAELLIIILNCGPRIRVSGHVQPRTFFFFFNGTFSSWKFSSSSPSFL